MKLQVYFLDKQFGLGQSFFKLEQVCLKRWNRFVSNAGTGLSQTLEQVCSLFLPRSTTLPKIRHFLTMPSIHINKDLRDQIYFVTIVVLNQYEFFDCADKFKILEETFVYCQENKGLKVYAFVFMPNHLHFIGEAGNLPAVIRDMKIHLSKKFKRDMASNAPYLLKNFTDKNRYRFWENTNYPKLIISEDFLQQKMDYIHYNPVKRGLVQNCEDWQWSSARSIPGKIKISGLDE